MTSIIADAGESRQRRAALLGRGHRPVASALEQDVVSADAAAIDDEVLVVAERHFVLSTSIDRV